MFAYSQTTQTQTSTISKALNTVKELARAYSMLFDSFDPRETVPDFLISDETQNEINEFAQIIDNIYNELENNRVINILPVSNRYDVFFKEIDELQRSKDFKDKPIPFKLIRYILRNLFTSLTSNTHSDYCIERNMFTFEITNEQVHQAINQITSADNIDRTKTNFKMLPPALFKHPKYNGKVGKGILTTHHVIGKKVLNQFRIYSDAILANNRQEMDGFDYHRIRDHNRRKLMYPHIRHVYKKYAPNDDIDKGTFTTLDKDKNFIDFIKKLQLLPPGLTFLGPRPEERSDDPDQIKGKSKTQTDLQDLYKARYGDYDEDFEYSCKAILGAEYFDRVLKLYNNIKAYNEDINIRTLERTIELINEIENIHVYRERRPYYSPDNSDFEAIFFGWYPDEEWNYDTTAHRWDIKTMEEITADENRPGTSGYRRSTSATTRFTSRSPTRPTTTTEDVFIASLFDDLKVNDRFKYTRDEIRRKREHKNYENDLECQSIIKFATKWERSSPAPKGRSPSTVSKSDDCNYYLNNGSPSILAVPVYGFCKLFG
ncbi:MAG: hypothetical protein ACRCZ0_09345 [Cetobacterium sp.]